MKIVISLTVALGTVVIGGCSSAESAAGPTQAEFAALQSTVTAQAATIASLQSQVAAQGSLVADTANAATRDQLVVSGGATGLQKAEGDVLFTVLGPVGGSIHGASAMEVVSTTGYSATLPAGSGTIAAREFSTVWFTAADCTGTAYLRNGLSDYNAQQGVVFRVGNDPQTARYLMLRAGTAVQTDLTFQSRREGGSCGAITFGPTFGYAAEDNDSGVSGIPSGPFGTSAKLSPTL